MMRTLIILSLFVSIASAEDKKPVEADDKKSVEMDELSKKLFDDWSKKEHNAGRAGAKKASFKIKATGKTPRGDMASTGNYAWDAAAEGDKGKLSWDNAMGEALGQQGWSVDTLNANFDPNPWLDGLKGSKLTATAGETGTNITVEGKNKGGITGFTFDKDGVLKEMRFSLEMMPGQNAKAVLKFTYKKEGDRYLATEWDMQLPDMQFKSVTKLTYVKVADKYQLWQKAVQTASMGGMEMGATTLEFTEHKVEN